MDSMSRTAKFAAFFACIIVCIGIVFVYVFFFSTKPNTEAQQKQVADIVATRDIAQCDKVTGLMIDNMDYYAVCRNNVALQLAQEAESFAQCDQVIALNQSAVTQASCYQDLVTRKLKEQNSLAVCDQLTDQKWNTLRSACTTMYWIKEAETKKDGTLCTNIRIASDQKSCQDNVVISELITRTPLSCSQFSGVLAQSCSRYKTLLEKLSPATRATTFCNVPEFETFCRSHPQIP